MDKNQFLPSRRVYSLSNKNKNLPKFTFSLQIPRAFSSACKWSGFFIWIQLGLENEKERGGGSRWMGQGLRDWDQFRHRAKIARALHISFFFTPLPMGIAAVHFKFFPIFPAVRVFVFFTFFSISSFRMWA